MSEKKCGSLHRFWNEKTQKRAREYAIYVFYQKIILVDFSTKNDFFVASIQKFSVFFMPGKFIIWLLFGQKWLLLVNNNRMSYYSVIICPKWLLASNNSNNNIGRKKCGSLYRFWNEKTQKEHESMQFTFFDQKIILVDFSTRLFCRFDSEIFTFFHARKKLLFSYYLSKMVS